MLNFLILFAAVTWLLAQETIINRIDGLEIREAWDEGCKTAILKVARNGAICIVLTLATWGFVCVTHVTPELIILVAELSKKLLLP